MVFPLAANAGENDSVDPSAVTTQGTKGKASAADEPSGKRPNTSSPDQRSSTGVGNDAFIPRQNNEAWNEQMNKMNEQMRKSSEMLNSPKPSSPENDPKASGEPGTRKRNEVLEAESRALEWDSTE
jgi:hypothetical protein